MHKRSSYQPELTLSIQTRVQLKRNLRIMSCDGWSIGDRCLTIEPMEVDVELGGENIGRSIVRENTPGIVRWIERAIHIMNVEFKGIRGIARLDHARVGNLRRL